MRKVLNFDKEINFPTMIGEITSIALDHDLKFTTNSDIEGSFSIKGTYKMTEASHLEEEFSYNIPISIALTENLEIDTCKVEIEDFYYEIVNEDALKCKIDVLVEGVEEVKIEELVADDCDSNEIEVIEETFTNVSDTQFEDVLIRECDGEEKEDKEKEEKEKKEKEEKEKKEKEKEKKEKEKKEKEEKEKEEKEKEDKEKEEKEKEEKEKEKKEKEEKEKEEIEKTKRRDLEKEMEKIKIYEEEMNKKVMELKKEDMMKEETKESGNENMKSIFSAFKDTEETYVAYSVYILRKNDTLDKIFDLYNVSHEELSHYNDLDNLTIGSKIIIPTQQDKVNE